MTIQQLQYILEVNRTGSITQAAKNLYLTQSSVSCAIGALESELGLRIFERSWQGVTPTDEGREVLAHAQIICEHHRLIQTKEPLRDNTVRIETGTYLPLSVVFGKLAKEYQNQKEVSLSHRTGPTLKSALERLSLGRTDLVVFLKYGIKTHPRSIDIPQKNLTWKVRKQIPMALRIGPGHPLYHKPDLVPEDLSGGIMIDTPDASMINFGPLRLFIEAAPDQVVLESDRSTRYTMASNGVGYLAGGLYPDHINRQYGFRNIPLDGLYYNLVSVINAEQPIRPEVQRYLDLLDEELAEIE